MILRWCSSDCRTPCPTCPTQLTSIFVSWQGVCLCLVYQYYQYKDFKETDQEGASWFLVLGLSAPLPVQVLMIFHRFSQCNLFDLVWITPHIWRSLIWTLHICWSRSSSICHKGLPSFIEVFFWQKGFLCGVRLTFDTQNWWSHLDHDFTLNNTYMAWLYTVFDTCLILRAQDLYLLLYSIWHLNRIYTDHLYKTSLSGKFGLTFHWYKTQNDWATD